MEIMEILICYVLPAIIVILIAPKAFASDVSSLEPDFSNPVSIGHLAMSVLLALIPFINFATVLLGLFYYLIHHKELFKNSILDKPLFKETSIK